MVESRLSLHAKARRFDLCGNAALLGGTVTSNADNAIRRLGKRKTPASVEIYLVNKKKRPDSVQAAFFT
jgi:hypothetical protein